VPKGVNIMTGIGWELWGVKFGMLFVTLVAAAVAMLVRLMTADSGHLLHVDTMAGDEGDD
jgi:hypothetical protein